MSEAGAAGAALVSAGVLEGAGTGAAAAGALVLGVPVVPAS